MLPARCLPAGESHGAAAAGEGSASRLDGKFPGGRPEGPPGFTAVLGGLSIPPP